MLVSAGSMSTELVSLIGGVPLAEQIQALIQYFPVAPVKGSIPDTTSCPSMACDAQPRVR